MRRMYSENQLEKQTEELLGSGNVPSIKADSIIENMSGYTFTDVSQAAQIVLDIIYAGACKNGNKLTLVVFGKITKPTGSSGSVATFKFGIPSSVGEQIYPITFAGADTRVDTKKVLCANTITAGVDLFMWCDKMSNTELAFGAAITSLTAETEYIFRYELTLLLSENLASD